MCHCLATVILLWQLLCSACPLASWHSRPPITPQPLSLKRPIIGQLHLIITLITAACHILNFTISTAVVNIFVFYNRDDSTLIEDAWNWLLLSDLHPTMILMFSLNCDAMRRLMLSRMGFALHYNNSTFAKVFTFELHWIAIHYRICTLQYPSHRSHSLIGLPVGWKMESR